MFLACLTVQTEAYEGHKYHKFFQQLLASFSFHYILLAPCLVEVMDLKCSNNEKAFHLENLFIYSHSCRCLLKN